LVYGSFLEERTWERVEGQSEPWERDVLFSQRELEHVLKYAKGELERRELQRIWREAEILPGRIKPETELARSAPTKSQPTINCLTIDCGRRRSSRPIPAARATDGGLALPAEDLDRACAG
jgi:hypothetical protein